MKRQIKNGAGEVIHEWDPRNIYDVIEFIRLKPGFSLGNSPRTIDNLSLYLHAYQDALEGTNLLDYGVPHFSHFSIWTCGWRKKGASVAGWAYHILHKARKNQEKAYNIFFELINKYKNSPITASKVLLTEKNIETSRYKISHNSDINDQNLLSAPHEIVIFQIGESDMSLTVFYDQAGLPMYDTDNDKSKDAFRQIEVEFSIKKNQWIQMSNNTSLALYKTTFRTNTRSVWVLATCE